MKKVYTESEKDVVKIALPSVISPGVHVAHFHKFDTNYSLHYDRFEDLNVLDRIYYKDIMFRKEMLEIAEKKWGDRLIGTKYRFAVFRMHDESFWDSLTYPCYIRDSRDSPIKIQVFNMYGIPYFESITISTHCEFITHHKHIYNELVSNINSIPLDYGLLTGRQSGPCGLSYNYRKFNRHPFTSEKMNYKWDARWLVDRSIIDYVIANQKSIEDMYQYDLTDRVLELPDWIKSTALVPLKYVDAEIPSKRKHESKTKSKKKNRM